MKHLTKKGAKDLDPMDKEAKLGVVGELHRQASSMLGDKVGKGMNKVSVAANSKEGLHRGLQKADSLLGHPAAGEDSELDHTGTSPDHEAEGSPEEEAHESHAEALAEGDISPEDAELEAEHSDKSPEELDAHIEKLIALKHKKHAGKA